MRRPPKGFCLPPNSFGLTLAGIACSVFAMTALSKGHRRTAANAVATRRFPPPAKDAAHVVVPYAARDYGVHELEEGHELQQAFVRVSDGRHFRVGPIEPFWRGTGEFCALSDGFFISFGDMEFDPPNQARMSFPEALQIVIASNGEGEYVFKDGGLLRFAAPNATFVIQPPGAPSIDATFSGRTRFVQVFIHREQLKTLFVGSEHELPGALQAFLDGSLQQAVSRILPLAGALLRCLEDILACPLEGRRRRLFLQSRAVEIVCQAIESFEQQLDSGTGETTLLTARGVLKAQRLLTENFVTPLPLEGLALEVGLSRSALCTGFRQMLGQSVFDYVHGLRMERALALLNERHASITEIAHAVGYNHTSSFSVAVQRHFGATPSELRRRSALPPS